MDSNTKLDMLKPVDEDIVIEFESDLARVGIAMFESISLDGQVLPVGENGNVDIPIGLNEINNRFDQLEENQMALGEAVGGLDTELKSYVDQKLGVIENGSY